MYDPADACFGLEQHIWYEATHVIDKTFCLSVCLPACLSICLPVCMLSITSYALNGLRANRGPTRSQWTDKSHVQHMLSMQNALRTR